MRPCVHACAVCGAFRVDVRARGPSPCHVCESSRDSNIETHHSAPLSIPAPVPVPGACFSILILPADAVTVDTPLSSRRRLLRLVLADAISITANGLDVDAGLWARTGEPGDALRRIHRPEAPRAAIARPGLACPAVVLVIFVIVATRRAGRVRANGLHVNACLRAGRYEARDALGRADGPEATTAHEATPVGARPPVRVGGVVCASRLRLLVARRHDVCARLGARVLESARREMRTPVLFHHREKQHE